jgi:hypothetical protein
MTEDHRGTTEKYGELCSAVGVASHEGNSRMTRSELHALVERLPEIALDDGSRRVALSYEELQQLTRVVIALADRLGELTREWMARSRGR